VNSNLLSVREKQAVDALLQGKSNKQIALSLGISERTVEFHLNNVYSKLNVASRVELILNLGKAKGDISANPVESTVEADGANGDNGNQSVRPRAAHSLRNTVSLIKKEVAMTIQISFEDLENYLRSHTWLSNLLVFLAASLSVRYVVFDVGLYFWASYILLGILLGWGSMRFGRMTHEDKQFSPLMILILSALLPLFVTGFDQLYLNTVLRYTDAVSISIANISATAQWLASADGMLYRSTQLSVTSDILWFIAIAYMLALFLLSKLTGKRSGENHLATV